MLIVCQTELLAAVAMHISILHIEIVLSSVYDDLATRPLGEDSQALSRAAN